MEGNGLNSQFLIKTKIRLEMNVIVYLGSR